MATKDQGSEFDVITSVADDDKLFVLDVSATALNEESAPTGTVVAITYANLEAQLDALYLPLTQSHNAQTGTTYTLVLTDANKLVTLTNGSAIALTVPANSSVAFPVGTQIDLAQRGAGAVTVAGAGGVTVNVHADDTLVLDGQYAYATLVKIATDTWDLFGKLVAA